MKNKYTITFSISILMLCSCSFLLGNDGLLEDCESVKTKCIQAFNASSYLKIIAFCFGYLSLGSRGVRTLGCVVRTRASNECSRRFHEVSQSRPSLVEMPTSCNDLQVYPHMRNVRGICQPIAHHIVVFKPLCCSDCQSDLGWQLQDTGTR